MKLNDKLEDIEALHNIVKCNSVISDMVISMCGKHISEGSFRSVYEYALDDKYVIKLENTESNCNVVEHMIWDEVKWLTGDLEWVKNWFAPVKWISPNGRVLVMEKTVPHVETTGKRGKKRPEKIPAFLWDIKHTNFGWLGKHYVCHDYGQFYNMINYPKKMQKVNWNTAGY